MNERTADERIMEIMRRLTAERRALVERRQRWIAKLVFALAMAMIFVVLIGQAWAAVMLAPFALMTCILYFCSGEIP